jgi:hypothetical protein
MWPHQVDPYGPPVTERPSETTSTGSLSPGHGTAPHYEIRVRGHLGSRWATWFDGLTLHAEDDGTTVLRGPVIDQAALHGLLQKLRDLGVALISLTPIDPPIEGLARPDERN